MAEMNISETREKLLKNRENAVSFLAHKMAAHPDMVKASKDIELIDDQLQKLDDLEKAEKEKKHESDLEAALKEAIKLFEGGEAPSDEKIAEIAEEYEVNVDELEDAIADEIQKEPENDDE